jgi:hypothetical protein
VTASGGSESERLAAAFAQLVAEGRPDFVHDFRVLMAGGHLTAAQVLEAIEFAETLATAGVEGEVTEEQVSALTEQLVEQHNSRRRG